MSNQEDFRRPEKPLEKTREIDNEARISKKAKMKRKFNRNQKQITLWDIQISSLIFLSSYIETNQLICGANQLTGLYMMATLVFNELRKSLCFREGYWQEYFLKAFLCPKSWNLTKKDSIGSVLLWIF